MKAFNTKTIAMAFAGLSFFACNREEEQEAIAPLKTTQDSELIGYDPTTCNLVQTFGTGELPRTIDVVEEDGAVMIVKAQRRGHNGKYLSETSGLLLNAFDPATDLLHMYEAPMLGVSGLLTVGDASGQIANQEGGRIILDFSPVGSVTMKTMLVTDIAEEDEGSKVELFSSTGQLLDQQEIPVAGDNEAVFVSFDNVPGVAKAVVTFGSERSNVGSGAIARLQLCIDGQGQLAEYCSGDIHSIWMQYTGDKPANIEVTATEAGTKMTLYSGKGVKPGTMFKLAAESGTTLGEALSIETNRKEKHTIPLQCDATTSIKKQYGSFTVVEARAGLDYPLQLQ